MLVPLGSLSAIQSTSKVQIKLVDEVVQAFYRLKYFAELDEANVTPVTGRTSVLLSR